MVLVYRFFCRKKIVGLLTSSCNIMQFQKREYAKVELFRCGKKGHGLQAKERISSGSFVIEYVGEVCPFLSRAGLISVFVSALCVIICS